MTATGRHSVFTINYTRISVIFRKAVDFLIGHILFLDVYDSNQYSEPIAFAFNVVVGPMPYIHLKYIISKC